MTFRDYLLDRALFRDDPVGDLARDVERDPRFPDLRADEPRALERHRDYLRCRGAAVAALDAFETAWRRYRAHLRG